MSKRDRTVRIDISRDLPVRSAPLAPNDLAQVFGGCRPEWVTCEQNHQCCSSKCKRMWWDSATSTWIYQCLPDWGG